MRIEFTLFGFKIQKVGLEIYFIVPSKAVVGFNLIGSIILNISRVLSLMSKYGMFLLLVVLVLRNTRIYTYTSNNNNIAFYIKGSIERVLADELL